MKKQFMTCLIAVLTSVGGAAAAESSPAWDRFPAERVTDLAALQNGAKLFVNYCLNCHSAAYMRYNRMQDLGLSEAQIKNNLLFSGGKIGDLMTNAMSPKDAKAWFGVVPPDLSVIARSSAGPNGSGADYLYTYLRSFYRDESRPTGWNNRVFPNVAMPHVLWELQGIQTPVYLSEGSNAHNISSLPGHGGSPPLFKGFALASPGTMSVHDYDAQVADLVAYLQWMSEPAQRFRVKLGVGVVIFLSVFWLIAWRLNASYWKDVK